MTSELPVTRIPAWPLPPPPADDEGRSSAWIFEDDRSRALLDTIRRVAPTDAGILVHGAAGSDKEGVARQVHELSRRRAGPFVAVNCGALTEQMVDAELFGFEHGAFTGAFGGQPGWLEEAHEGTCSSTNSNACPSRCRPGSCGRSRSAP